MNVARIRWSLLALVVLGTPLHAARMEYAHLAGQPIRDIRITAAEVFDPSRPGENRRIFGWVNALHVRTRTQVIERELLFRVGEPLDPLALEESERNLRALGIFQDARITVEPIEAGVRVNVSTSDRWSTKLITDVSSQGDILRVRLGLENSNFLGTATNFGGSFTTSSDTDALDLGYQEPRLFGSRWQLGLRFASDELSDSNRFRLRHPFYSERVHWTADLDVTSRRGERRVFLSEVATDTLDLLETRSEVFVGLHGQRPVRTRWGVLFSRRSLKRDVDARQSALLFSGSLLRRSYRRLVDLDEFTTSEDVAAGWTIQAGLGADLRLLGADHDRPLYRLDLGYARFLGRASLAGVGVRHHGFYRNGRVENGALLAESFGFWKHHGHALVWSLGTAALLNEPRHRRFTLGGSERLRGYAARHSTGTRALWFNLEERLFTSFELFFLRLGGAVFVDVGQAWDAGDAPAWRDLGVGAGVGLRIGNNKSGNGVMRLDVAFGRSQVEISFASSSFFRVARGLEHGDPRLLR